MNMKRRLWFFTVFILLAALEYGQEASSTKPGFSLGGGTILESSSSGGFLEFGFPIHQDAHSGIFNYVTFDGFGSGHGGIVLVTDKVTIGGGHSTGLQPYGFIEGGLGLFGTTDKNFVQAPYLWSLDGGGGLEIAISPAQAFFFEFGGGGNSITSNQAAYPQPFVSGFAKMTMGMRVYLQ
jgi:hypothetical protein